MQISIFFKEPIYPEKILPMEVLPNINLDFDVRKQKHRNTMAIVTLMNSNMGFNKMWWGGGFGRGQVCGQDSMVGKGGGGLQTGT